MLLHFYIYIARESTVALLNYFTIIIFSTVNSDYLTNQQQWTGRRNKTVFSTREKDQVVENLGTRVYRVTIYSITRLVASLFLYLHL